MANEIGLTQGFKTKKTDKVYKANCKTSVFRKKKKK